MSDDIEPASHPRLEVVRGEAEPEDIAALLAVLAAMTSPDDSPGGSAGSPVRGWSDRRRMLPRSEPRGPGWAGI